MIEICEIHDNITHDELRHLLSTSVGFGQSGSVKQSSKTSALIKSILEYKVLRIHKIQQ